MKKVTYNYFKSDKRRVKKDNVVRYGKFVFVCDSQEDADLMRKWLKEGKNFEIK